MARMGYRVTAVDIDPNFVGLIGARAEMLGLDIDARVGGFLDCATIGGQFDAVVFYECFHHCSDHARLLADLHEVVAEGGRVFLAAEPILESFHAPWGLRLDGESLWAIRSNGWLELGFTESYFVETCMRLGWRVVTHRSSASHLTSVFELQRLGDALCPGELILPPTDDAGWAERDSTSTGQRYTRERSRMVCPVAGPWGTAEVEFVNPSPRALPFVIRHGESVVRGIVERETVLPVSVVYDAQAGEIVFETEIWCPAALIPGHPDTRLLGLGVRQIRLR